MSRGRQHKSLWQTLRLPPHTACQANQVKLLYIYTYISECPTLFWVTTSAGSRLETLTVLKLLVPRHVLLYPLPSMKHWHVLFPKTAWTNEQCKCMPSRINILRVRKKRQNFSANTKLRQARVEPPRMMSRWWQHRHKYLPSNNFLSKRCYIVLNVWSCSDCEEPKTASDGDSIKTSTCLPRQKALDVTKRHACHAKDRGVTGHKRGPSMSQVPRLPRKSKVNVTKRHACHAKCVWMSPSATPATQKTAASPATSVDQACHKSQPSDTSATPATQKQGYHQVPRLPSQMCLDVTKRHACHATDRGVTGDERAQSASQSQEPAQRHKRDACHAKAKSMSPSATPATCEWVVRERVVCE